MFRFKSPQSGRMLVAHRLLGRLQPGDLRVPLADLIVIPSRNVSGRRLFFADQGRDPSLIFRRPFRESILERLTLTRDLLSNGRGQGLFFIIQLLDIRLILLFLFGERRLYGLTRVDKFLFRRRGQGLFLRRKGRDLRLKLRLFFIKGVIAGLHFTRDLFRHALRKRGLLIRQRLDPGLKLRALDTKLAVDLNAPGIQPSLLGRQDLKGRGLFTGQCLTVLGLKRAHACRVLISQPLLIIVQPQNLFLPHTKVLRGLHRGCGKGILFFLRERSNPRLIIPLHHSIAFFEQLALLSHLLGQAPHERLLLLSKFLKRSLMLRPLSGQYRFDLRDPRLTTRLLDAHSLGRRSLVTDHRLLMLGLKGL